MYLLRLKIWIYKLSGIVLCRWVSLASRVPKAPRVVWWWRADRWNTSLYGNTSPGPSVTRCTEIQQAKFDPKCGKTRCKYTHKASGLNSLSPVNFSPKQPCWNQLNKTPLTPTMKDILVISFRKYMTSYSPSSENQKIYDIISGETLCRDNCQLIGMSLIGLARQAQKNRD